MTEREALLLRAVEAFEADPPPFGTDEFWAVSRANNRLWDVFWVELAPRVQEALDNPDSCLKQVSESYALQHLGGLLREARGEERYPPGTLGPVAQVVSFPAPAQGARPGATESQTPCAGPEEEAQEVPREPSEES